MPETKNAITGQVFELTGSLTLQDIKNANPAFLSNIPSTYFNNVNELYTLLNEKGVLILRNAVLKLSGDADKKVLLGLHRIEMINSEIFIQDNDITILCNEYRQLNSRVHSFPEERMEAADGPDGTGVGTDGKTGADGLDSGEAFVFVTDKIMAASGNIDYNLAGQNAGSGGNGTVGKNGKEGARGRNCSDGGYQCNRGNGPGHNGENGGKGGDGGDGGVGGDGGKLTFSLHGNEEPQRLFFTFNAQAGRGGNPGTPAAGGSGGRGGRPGSSGCGSICAPYSNRSGNNGNPGPMGHAGHLGANGTAKVLTRLTFNVETLKAFLSQWEGLSERYIASEKDSMIIQRSGISITS